jgi:hypothetical protein
MITKKAIEQLIIPSIVNGMQTFANKLKPEIIRRTPIKTGFLRRNWNNIILQKSSKKIILKFMNVTPYAPHPSYYDAEGNRYSRFTPFKAKYGQAERLIYDIENSKKEDLLNEINHSINSGNNKEIVVSDFNFLG